MRPLRGAETTYFSRMRVLPSSSTVTQDVAAVDFNEVDLDRARHEREHEAADNRGGDEEDEQFAAEVTHELISSNHHRDTEGTEKRNWLLGICNLSFGDIGNDQFQMFNYQ